MRANSKRLEKIKLRDKELEDVHIFTYLGSVVTSDGGADEDVKSRIGKARQAFNTLRPVWNSTSISTKTKLQIFTTNVKSVLLYGSETWRVTRSISNKLQTFINKCLRRILKIYWPEKSATGNFGQEQGKNVFQKRSPGANGIGSDTLCGSQHLTQPGRPWSGIRKAKGR